MLVFRYANRNDNNQGFKNESRLQKYTKNEIILLSHTRNGNVLNRIKVSMHKLPHSKKSNQHVHKENQTGRLKVDEKRI